MPELFADVLHHAVYWLDYWFLFNLASLILVGVWLEPDSILVGEGGAPYWIRAWVIFFLLFSVSSALVLVLDIRELTGEPLNTALGSLIPVLTSTYFGDIWLMRLGALLIMAGVTAWFVLSAPGRTGVILAGLCLVVLSFTYSATSHAANQGNFTLLQLTHWLHLLAAMAWAGAILGAHRQFEVIREQHDSVSHLSRCLLRLSRLATVAFVPALAGGLYVAWWLLAGRLDLPDDPYKQSLATKLVFVVGMLVVAARLRFHHIPGLARGTQSADIALGEVRRALRVDRALVAMVLLMAADLTHQIPPVDLLAAPTVD